MAKWRINPYTKKQREIASTKGFGLVCISWQDPDGNRSDWYGPVDGKTLTYVKRAQTHAINKSLEPAPAAEAAHDG